MAFGAGRNGEPRDVSDIPSGFRPYPQQGFQIQPQQNFWQGGNFHMPGVTPGRPTMPSNLMQNFPGLAGLLQAMSPPQMSGQSPFVGGLPGAAVQPPDRRRGGQRGRFD